MTSARNINFFLAPSPDVLPWTGVYWFLTSLALNLQLCLGTYVVHGGTIRLFSAGISMGNSRAVFIIHLN